MKSSPVAAVVIPVGGSEFLEEPGGSVRIDRPAYRVARFTMTGYFSLALAEFGMGRSGAILDEINDDYWTFYDWEKMTGYASAARSLSTSFMLERRRRHRCVVILTGSALVSMGVNVANLALGGFMQATTEREKLDRLQTEALTLSR